ncbi:DUF6221 family protein [Streptomyces sp. NPDC048257]
MHGLWRSLSPPARPVTLRSAGLAYAIRVLAQPYAEHPAYRQEWRP